MGNNQVKIYSVLVIGLTNAGKTHFLDMLTFGGDTTKSHTVGWYETAVVLDEHTTINLIETSSVHHIKPMQYCAIYLIVPADATFEQLQTSKNMLLHARQSNELICIIYNNRGGAVNFSFKERNRLLQIQRGWAAIEVDFSDSNKWKNTVLRVLQWTVAHNNSAK